MKTAASESKLSSPLKSDDLGGKATTFFFSNFPEFWEESELWWEFRTLGNMVDVFVARKRNKIGRKFGFVRFIRVQDTGRMEFDLNNHWMDKFKLKANLAKYSRKEEKVGEVKIQKIKSVVVGPGFQGRVTTESSRDGTGRREHSYAEAVNGSPPPPPPCASIAKQSCMAPINSEVNEVNSIHVIPTNDTLERLSRYLFGEVRCLETLRNLNEFPTVEGLNDVKVSYYGGLAALLEFRSKEAAKDYLILARGTWSKWFSDLSSWAPEEHVMKRFASLTIVGLPPHAWVPGVFSDIGTIWGDVVIPDSCDGASQIRDRGRVVILTQQFSTINESVEVRIGNIRHRIMVVEDFKASASFGPDLSRNPGKHESKDEEDKIVDSEESLCDENSDFDFDGDDNMGFDPAGDENQDTAFDGDGSPERRTSHGNDYQHAATIAVKEFPEKYRHAASIDAFDPAGDENQKNAFAGDGSPERTTSDGNGYQHAASIGVKELPEKSQHAASIDAKDSTEKQSRYHSVGAISKARSASMRSNYGKQNKANNFGPQIHFGSLEHEKRPTNYQTPLSPSQVFKVAENYETQAHVIPIVTSPTSKINTSSVLPNPTISLTAYQDDFLAEQSEKTIEMEEGKIDDSTIF
ncbi:hypothetical protein LXL04_006675 [Taraxacum kok-saghyz]